MSDLAYILAQLDKFAVSNPEFIQYGFINIIKGIVNEVGGFDTGKIDALEFKFDPAVAGKLKPIFTPNIAITAVHVVASEVAQLALTVEVGDIAVRTDEEETYICTNPQNLSMADWVKFMTFNISRADLGLATTDDVVFNKVTAGSVVAPHNNLTNFDGGAAGELYHLTLAQHTGNAYFDAIQTWTASQTYSSTNGLRFGDSSNPPRLFNQGTKFVLGEYIGKTQGVDQVLNQLPIWLGTAGDSLPLLGLEVKSVYDVGPYRVVDLSQLYLNHVLEIPFVLNADGFSGTTFRMLAADAGVGGTTGSALVEFGNYNWSDGLSINYSDNDGDIGGGWPDGFLMDTYGFSTVLVGDGSEHTAKFRFLSGWNGATYPFDTLLSITQAGVEIPQITHDMNFPDNIKLLFGTGDDVSVYWDGTDFRIDALTASTKILLSDNIDEIGNASTLKFIGQNIYFQPTNGLYLGVGAQTYMRCYNNYVQISKPLTFEDNIKCQFGTGADVAFYYDGVNLIFDNDVVADSNLLFKNTVWDDIRVAATAVKLPAANAPDWVNLRDGVYTFAFDDSTDEEVFFSCQLPHRYKNGTDLKPHIHWTAGNSVDTGTVVWKVEYTIASVNGILGATTTVDLSDAGDGTAYTHLLTAEGTISGTGIQESAMLICRLYRDADNVLDTFTGDAFLMEFDLHFEVEKLGTKTSSPGT